VLAIAPALMPASEARTMAALSRPTAASSSRIACWSSSSESATFNKLRGDGQSGVSPRAGYRRVPSKPLAPAVGDVAGERRSRTALRPTARKRRLGVAIDRLLARMQSAALRTKAGGSSRTGLRLEEPQEKLLKKALITVLSR
jgi:hypothetical protein